MSTFRVSSVLVGSFLLFALGCHSVQLKAPPGSDPEADSQHTKDYLWARANQTLDPAKACATFSALASNSTFPAHDIARLRALEVCQNDVMPTLNRTQWPSYLQDIVTDIYLRLASERGDKSTELEMALEKSKGKLSQTEKVKWMNLALQRADELGLADRKLELKKRLYMLAPRLDPDVNEKDYLSVATDLRMARKFSKARDFYNKVLHSEAFDVDAKIIAHKGIRLSFKNARQNEAHIQSAQKLITYLTKQLKANPRSRSLMTATYDAKTYLARALWTLGQTSGAEKIFAQLQKSMKGKMSLAELYWLRGRLAEDKGDLEAVSHYMDLALKERIPDSDMRDKVLWYSAWNERRRSNLTRATEILIDLDQKTQTDFTRARALYWLGRTQFENKQPEAGKATLKRLVDTDPLGYYGLLAHNQLEIPIKFKATPIAIGAGAPLQLPMDANLADWLTRLNENEALTALLDETSQSYKKSKEQSDEGWVRIFQYYAHAGLYMKLYESLGTLPPERRKTIFELHPDLLFPQPWSEDANRAGEKFGIEPELIYAIIRQESAFDPHARSLADAFGVMQLLPEVAEEMSTKYGIPYSTMDDLYDPKTNMLLGAAHLKELFDRHKGQFILAVASYNASESVIRGWMKSRFRGDPMEFIEDIPYEETRSYVRLVMRNLIFYNLLKSKSAAIDFPAWVLKLEG